MVTVYRNGWYVLIYVLGMVALGYHLLHGFVTAARTLGIYHPRYANWNSDRRVDLQHQHQHQRWFRSRTHLPPFCDTIVMLDAKIPEGPLENKWRQYRSTANLVSAAN